MSSTWLKKSCIGTVIVFLGLFALTFLVPIFDLVPFEILRHLVIGGFVHTWESLPHMIPSLSTLVGFAVLVILSVCALQMLLTQFAESEDGSGFRWRPKWTLSVVGLVLAAIGTACATVGLAHHVPWLARDGVAYYDSGRGTVSTSISNCRQMILALKLYAADRGGAHPKQLEDLVREEVVDEESFVKINRMIGRDGLQAPLVLLAGVGDIAPGDMPLVIGSCPVGKNRYLLGLNDSTVSAVNKEEFEEAMTRYRKFVGIEGKSGAAP